jgi:hypothetical protein
MIDSRIQGLTIREWLIGIALSCALFSGFIGLYTLIVGYVLLALAVYIWR